MHLTLQLGELKYYCSLWNVTPGEKFQIQYEIASAAYHSTNYSNPEVGHCKCSVLKILRFGRHQDAIPHPSFLGGCSRFIPLEEGKHDKGIPV